MTGRGGVVARAPGDLGAERHYVTGTVNLAGLNSALLAMMRSTHQHKTRVITRLQRALSCRQK